MATTRRLLNRLRASVVGRRVWPGFAPFLSSVSVPLHFPVMIGGTATHFEAWCQNWARRTHRHLLDRLEGGPGVGPVAAVFFSACRLDVRWPPRRSTQRASSMSNTRIALATRIPTDERGAPATLVGLAWLAHPLPYDHDAGWQPPEVLQSWRGERLEPRGKGRVDGDGGEHIFDARTGIEAPPFCGGSPRAPGAVELEGGGRRYETVWRACFLQGPSRHVWERLSSGPYLPLHSGGDTVLRPHGLRRIVQTVAVLERRPTRPLRPDVAHRADSIDVRALRHHAPRRP